MMPELGIPELDDRVLVWRHFAVYRIASMLLATDRKTFWTGAYQWASKNMKERDALEVGDDGFIGLRDGQTVRRARWAGSQQAKGSREAVDISHRELGDSSRLANVESG
jgi:hypothetical protein